jgi:heterodisulfide reductase subunit A
MMDAGRHPNIELLTYSEVEEVSGYVGNFQVKVRNKARHVNANLCTGCGLCQEKCPQKAIPSEFDQGLGKRSAIYIPFPQAIPRVPVIDTERCTYFLKQKCRACEKLCPAGAIDFEQEDEIVELDAGAVIVATGFEQFQAEQLPQYNRSLSPDIIDGLQFERLSSATGPTQGEILTSRGVPPKRVAIIHCVGARDEYSNVYCSRVCCMYALKHAHLVRDKTDAEVYEFYMDIRAAGKGYEEFYKRVQEEEVFFVRGRGAEVTVLDDGRLMVLAEDTILGKPVSVKVDLVVLDSAMISRSDCGSVASTFGIGRSEDGFFLEAHPKLRPVETNTDGILLAGACQAPRDVPDTVAHADAAAGRCLSLLSRGEVTISPTVAAVDEQHCSGCCVCIDLCPYGAISLVTHDGSATARINEALCKGCGTCVAACPAGAIKARHFTDAQIYAEIVGLLHGAQEEEAEADSQRIVVPTLIGF